MMSPFTHARANLIFLLILVPCALAVFRFDRNESQDISEEAQRLFESDTSVRHERLVTQFNRQHQLLRSIVAFFNASSNVEQHEFGQLAQTLGRSKHPSALCWTSSDERVQFARGQGLESLERNASELCAGFEFLEPSRILGRTDPWILLSKYAQSGSQRGYATVVFQIRSLFLDDPLTTLDEHLVITDQSHNTALSYSFKGGGKSEKQPPEALDEVGERHAELARFGDIHIRYLTLRMAAKDDGVDYRLASMLGLLALSLLAAFLVRSLLIKRMTIANEVRQRTDELSQFTYRTSHDLRAPLVTVGGLCRVVKEDLEDGNLEEVELNIGRIGKEVGRLDRLVADILEMTRADLHTTAVETIDFKSLIAEAIEDSNTTFGDHGVDINVDIDVARAHQYPRARLAQIVGNLLSNGIKYRKPNIEDPIVSISVREPRGVVIVVSDNGLGIPEELHSRLFEMFERFHPEVTTVGSGLGMSIVKKHVERLGGTIALTSTPEGSSISVSLPNTKEQLS